MRPGTVLRGNIVIIDFAPMNPNAGIRPALVVQNDHDNGRMGNTIVAQNTSNVSRAHENTQLLIDSSHHNWSMSGLRRPSVVNCCNIVFVKQRHITRLIGNLSTATMREIDNCLKVALGIS
jgi:mRNA interferase MazF